ncbi:hypothetical protein HQ865_23050 [Mucilaginibacter mali]|uniref:Uncharacterized protein n=1 Tax=Mucilaginibacter mali TaxID=2740462 RepID=A0A7D4TXS2_9SPHI|nr:hypothetical protein [Mucilaginibacter mali]QKJ32515.1 hypothetical protein HQ865_23050 [Mucilaginibacter mali]
MKTEAIKFDLHDKIDHADVHQLEDLHALVTNYLKGDSADNGWDTLSKSMQDKLSKSIQQVDAGLGTPARDVIGDIKSNVLI